VNDAFEKKVRAAAAAAWWVVLIGYALLLVTWVIYVIMVHSQPSWLPAMWGPDVNWAFMQTVSLWLMGVFKLLLWFMFLAALWLTLWAKYLRKL